MVQPVALNRDDVAQIVPLSLRTSPAIAIPAQLYENCILGRDNWQGRRRFAQHGALRQAAPTNPLGAELMRIDGEDVDLEASGEVDDTERPPLS